MNRSIHVSGNFNGTEKTFLIDLLPEPQPRRAYKMLSVAYTVLGVTNNEDRHRFALNAGEVNPALLNSPAGVFEHFIEADPIRTQADLILFGHANLGRADAVAQPQNARSDTEQLQLDDLILPLRVQGLVHLVDLVSFTEWSIELHYQELRVSQSDWIHLRQQNPVEHRSVGTHTVS